METRPGDTQELRRFRDVASGAPQCICDHPSIRLHPRCAQRLRPGFTGRAELQIHEVQGAPSGHEDSLLDDILELTHVSRPRVLFKDFLGARGEAESSPVELSTEPIEEIVSKKQDVLLTFSQGRKPEIDH